jgi:hypothetical protein
MDSRDPIFEHREKDFEKDDTIELESTYPDDFEEIDANLLDTKIHTQMNLCRNINAYYTIHTKG